jgi:hypothetical protein
MALWLVPPHGPVFLICHFAPFRSRTLNTNFSSQSVDERRGHSAVTAARLFSEEPHQARQQRVESGTYLHGPSVLIFRALRHQTYARRMAAY